MNKARWTWPWLVFWAMLLVAAIAGVMRDGSKQVPEGTKSMILVDPMAQYGDLFREYNFQGVLQQSGNRHDKQLALIHQKFAQHYLQALYERMGPKEWVWVSQAHTEVPAEVKVNFDELDELQGVTEDVLENQYRADLKARGIKIP